MNTSNSFAQALDTFAEEARERIAEMEEILLRAESGTVCQEDLHALFRSAHTIKGSGGLFGLDGVVRFTHVVENVLDRLRNGAIRFDSDLVTLLLQAQDQIAALVAVALAGETNPELDARSEQLTARLRQWAADTPDAALAPPPEPSRTGGAAIGADAWHLSLRFAPTVFADGLDPLTFINYLSNLGQIKHVETVVFGLPDFDGADPESCYLGFELALHSAATKREIEQVFDYVANDALIRIFPPHTKTDEFIRLIEEPGNEGKRLGEILVACGTLTENELRAALAAQQAQAGGKLLGQIVIESGQAKPDVVEAAVARQRRTDEHKPHEASVKVPSRRLDALIDQVGELVTVGAGVHAQAGRGNREALLESASQLLALVESIRDMTLGLRMVPIGEVFSRFHRVVRDVSKELGKQIELAITGADTELDKSMIEKLGDPLMHLIRNAIDHGIEPAEERVARGKSAHGTLRLNAYHESGTIMVEVIDDGRGLNAGKILAKAIEKGLLPAGAAPSEQEIYRMILEPGFSTAEQVTDLSGRGVGMDVVRSSVESMRGTLDIQSVAGAGTTMRICLPLTLAIIDGFHVGVGGSQLIVPLDSVVECVELPPGQAANEYMELRGEALPYVCMRRLFGESGPAQARQRVVVARFGGRRVGLVVDRIHGKCQTVIKPLGPFFEHVPCVSGSTVLGSGDVALIIDIAQLVHDVARREHRRTRRGSAAPALAE